MGRFAIAAKHCMSLAEMYESQIVDLEKAIKYYEQVKIVYLHRESYSPLGQMLLAHRFTPLY